MARIRIGVCHRSRLLSELLAEALAADGKFECCVFDHCAAPVSISKSNGSPVQLLLLDATLDGERANLIAHHVRTAYPGSRMLLLVSETASDHLLELAPLQGDGWVPEEISVSELREAISSIVSGQSYCSPKLASAMLSQLSKLEERGRSRLASCDARLSEREREVLKLIALEALSNKQIARRLLVSIYTVKNHVHNIIQKLGANDRHDAARMARKTLSQP